MQYITYIFSFALCSFMLFFLTSKADAISQSVVISQVQTGGSSSGTAGQEFVELYNNSSVDIDMSGWCITYSSSSNVSQLPLYCINGTSTVKIWLKAKSFATFVSSDYMSATGFGGDGIFNYNGGMAATGGVVRLFDTSKHEIDKFAWGMVSGESTRVQVAVGKVYQRAGGAIMQDTGAPTDFIESNPTIHSSGIYEQIIDVCPNIENAQIVIPEGMTMDTVGNCVVPPPIDVCPNIADLQTQLPGGYLVDDVGNCQPDSCMNLDGLQISVPDYYDSNAIGECIEHDECPNQEGAQHNVPEGMVKNESGNCVLDLVPLEITEILPNAKGSDGGKEFIEIYNPSDKTVDLVPYIIQTGIYSDKIFTFPSGATILPGERKTFNDSEIGFTLGNASGRVVLASIDGTVFSDTGIYEAAGDNMAWAYIGGVWQYTDQPSPGEINTASLIEVVDDDTATVQGVAACAAGKYRNPLTNRCRSIESDATVLASCDIDQYRNPETGRCRKIASASSLTPCKDGQYRSEETNRCRSISAATSELAPCKEGQERNPDTNRCRNAAAKSVPAAAYAIEPVKDSAKAFVGWWALGGILLLAMGYAGWEWRREIGVFVRKGIPIRRK